MIRNLMHPLRPPELNRAISTSIKTYRGSFAARVDIDRGLDDVILQAYVVHGVAVDRFHRNHKSGFLKKDT